MSFYQRDFTDIHKFTRDELLYIMDKAVDMKRAISARDVAKYRLAEGRDMIAALLRLARDNFSHLRPHPFWVWLTYSHPPLRERIRAIEKIAVDLNPNGRSPAHSS